MLNLALLRKTSQQTRSPVHIAMGDLSHDVGATTLSGNRETRSQASRLTGHQTSQEKPRQDTWRCELVILCITDEPVHAWSFSFGAIPLGSLKTPINDE